MDLKQFEALGAFKDRSLVKRPVTVSHYPKLPEDQWKEPGVPEFGEEKVEEHFDVMVKRRNSADSIELSRVDPRLLVHYDVFRCIVDENGEQLFPSIERVIDMEEWLLLPLFNAVAEVNRTGPKRFPPKTKPGASSRSDSGVARSRSGRKRSRQKS